MRRERTRRRVKTVERLTPDRRRRMPDPSKLEKRPRAVFTVHAPAGYRRHHDRQCVGVLRLHRLFVPDAGHRATVLPRGVQLWSVAADHRDVRRGFPDAPGGRDADRFVCGPPRQAVGNGVDALADGGGLCVDRRGADLRADGGGRARDDGVGPVDPGLCRRW
ncbi:hypothetical protein G6F22_019225 [Rhizopus arrhizus]|nr:hypothetical protein G6F22_019225 [Rhizopus arrhizus]